RSVLMQAEPTSSPGPLLGWSIAMWRGNLESTLILRNSRQHLVVHGVRANVSVIPARIGIQSFNSRSAGKSRVNYLKRFTSASLILKFGGFIPMLNQPCGRRVSTD
ncbi:MAG: hypothetical protein ACTHMT_08470, partial [Verrucomicrobiota bacterium]